MSHGRVSIQKAKLNRGHKPKGYLDPTQVHGECEVLQPADPVRVEVYRQTEEYKKQQIDKSFGVQWRLRRRF